MTDPYAPPANLSEAEQSRLRRPVRMKIAAVASALGCLFVVGLVGYLEATSPYGVHWTRVAMALAIYASPNVFLYLSFHGQKWARTCFVLSQGVLLLSILALAVLILTADDNGLAIALPLALLIATSVYCMMHDSTKAWLARNAEMDAGALR